jgi:glucose-6-phosphate isomerase
MPPTFGASIKQVQEFAAKCAYDDAFRKKLKSNPRAVMAQYGIQIDQSDVPSVRTLPSKAQCAELLAVLQEYDAYSKGKYDPSAVACFILFYGFAMPLVPTVEGEVGAAR